MVGQVEAMWPKLARGEFEFMICSDWNSAWQIPDGMPVRIESLGHFPVSLIVRKGHPLLSGSTARNFPLLVSNLASFNAQLRLELREHLAGSTQVIGELTALRALVRDTDAIWLTSSFVVMDELLAGQFDQLPFPEGIAPQTFELFLYSLIRRTKSPSANELEDTFRRRISDLAGLSSPLERA